MNEKKAREDFLPSPQAAVEGETLRLPNGLPDPEPLRRAASFLKVASAALAHVRRGSHPDLEASARDLHRLVCACQELITEWINACGSIEPRKQWLAWDALDVLELIDMAADADRREALEKACNAAADLLERLARDCEVAPSTAEVPSAPEAVAPGAVNKMLL